MTATGWRSTISMETDCGQERDTVASRTTGIVSTRARIAWRSSRVSGSPIGTCATRCTRG